MFFFYSYRQVTLGWRLLILWASRPTTTAKLRCCFHCRPLQEYKTCTAPFLISCHQQSRQLSKSHVVAEEKYQVHCGILS